MRILRTLALGLKLNTLLLPVLPACSHNAGHARPTVALTQKTTREATQKASKLQLTPRQQTINEQVYTKSALCVTNHQTPDARKKCAEEVIQTLGIQGPSGSW